MRNSKSIYYEKFTVKWEHISLYKYTTQNPKNIKVTKSSTKSEIEHCKFHHH
uniref:Uncharacterized protein n=1 Tax=Arundo donax TaxID=35708 RepID=A0A0A9HI86_ARUDO